MSNDSRNFEIKITTTTDPHGAQQAASNLEDVSRQTAKASEQVDIFNTHGHEMHRLMEELDRVLPGTGLLLRLAFDPATLGIAGILFALEGIKSALAQYNQQLDEVGKTAAKADFAKCFQAAADAARDAITEQETYLHNLKEIKEGEHGITAEMGSQLQLIAAIEAAKQAQAEADKTLAEAKIREQEVTGQISPSQAIIERGRIEEQYVRDKRAADERQFKEEQDARINAADAAAARQAELDKKQKDAADTLAAARKRKTEADALPDDIDEQIKAANAASDEATAKLQHAQENPGEGRFTEESRRRHLEDLQASEAAAQARVQDLMALQRRKREAHNTALATLELPP